MEIDGLVLLVIKFWVVVLRVCSAGFDCVSYLWFIWVLCFGVRCSCGLMLTWFSVIVSVLVNTDWFSGLFGLCLWVWVVFMLSFAFAYLIIWVLLVGFALRGNVVYMCYCW